MMEEEHETSSLRAMRRKKSSVGLSCCFNISSQHRRSASLDPESDSSPGVAIPRRPSSSWMTKSSSGRPTTDDQIKGKYRSFISRMSRHRRHSSAEFSYDPLSYALNFDDEEAPSDDDYRRSKDFTSRLPASPPMRTTTSSNKATLLHLPRTSQVLHRSPPPRREEESPTHKAATNHELRRGFDALSASMRRTNLRSELPSEEANIRGARSERRTNKAAELSSSRTAGVANVRKSLELDEEVKSPVAGGISSRREILVQLC